jgi:hypothetical protein
VLSDNRHGLKPSDRVRSKRTNYLPFTGTVEHVWTDLVKVRFDAPQGPHGFTVTPGDSLEKIEDRPVHVGLPRGGDVVFHPDGKTEINAPEVVMTGTVYGVSGGLLMNDAPAGSWVNDPPPNAWAAVAPLPPHQPEEDPAIVYPLVEGDPKQP